MRLVCRLTADHEFTLEVFRTHGTAEIVPAVFSKIVFQAHLPQQVLEAGQVAHFAHAMSPECCRRGRALHGTQGQVVIAIPGRPGLDQAIVILAVIN